jgi:hypothetical protein
MSIFALSPAPIATMDSHRCVLLGRARTHRRDLGKISQQAASVNENLLASCTSSENSEDWKRRQISILRSPTATIEKTSSVPRWWPTTFGVVRPDRGSLGLLSIPSEPDQPTLIARPLRYAHRPGLLVALHYMNYNFCRIHKTLRVTPAMAAGVTDHPWGNW